MFVWLTKKWRERAAAILVALYALCLVAPVTAFAFSNEPAHCLTVTDDHHGKSDVAMAGGHVHQDGMDHHKFSDDPSPPASADHPGKCCGLFCVTALTPPAFGDAEVHPVQAAAVTLPAAELLFGRSSSRIDRPPRLLASF